MRQSQERSILQNLKRARLTPLEPKTYCEIGCGKGQWLQTMNTFGVDRTNIAGIDLMDFHAEYSQKLMPEADIRCGDASNLPWADASFDMVGQFTVLTSVLDDTMKRNIAVEMWRILKPGGAILWGDFHFNNPKNANVRGIKKKEIHALFPNGRLMLSRTLLAPPISRRLVKHSWVFAQMLEFTKILNSHYFGVIVKDV